MSIFLCLRWIRLWLLSLSLWTWRCLSLSPLAWRCSSPHCWSRACSPPSKDSPNWIQKIQIQIHQIVYKKNLVPKKFKSSKPKFKPPEAGSPESWPDSKQPSPSSSPVSAKKLKTHFWLKIPFKYLCKQTLKTFFIENPIQMSLQTKISLFLKILFKWYLNHMSLPSNHKIIRYFVCKFTFL